MKFDDDIPVLTDVIRTRTGRARPPASPTEAPAVADAPETVELLPLDLVIGHDIRTALEPYATTDFGGTLDVQESLIEPLQADHAKVPLSDEYATPPPDYFQTAASSESERGALLASEDAGGVVEHASMKPVPDSVSVDVGASIDAPEATEGDQALVDASLVPEVDPLVASDALASRVQDAVLQDLASRIDTELDARIAQALRFELEVALASLQGGLREQLASGLKDVVQRAVNDEISRIKSEGPRS